VELSWGFSYEVLPREALAPADKALLAHAEAAAGKAYAPYSDFPVGAAVRLQDGSIFTGNNQENLAFPSGLCAERVVLFQVGALGKAPQIEALAVYAPKAAEVAFPCGACRQVMIEYEQMNDRPWTLIFAGAAASVYRMKGVSLLLPLHFVWKRS
jgi:cytidine deaminase